MSKIAAPARPAHPLASPAPPTGERLAQELVPLAAELVGVVHDHGPHAYGDVFARIPGDQWHSLAVVLAAMVNPDARPSELLAWTRKPARSLDGTAYDVNPAEPWHHRRRVCPGCGEVMLARHLPRHMRRQHPDATRAA